jgi:hypothetical protein
VVAYARKKEKPLAPRMKVSEKGGVTQIAPDHPEAAVAHVLLMEATGAKDLDFLDGLLMQLVNAGTQGSTADERGLNFMLSGGHAGQAQSGWNADAPSVTTFQRCSPVRCRASVRPRVARRSRGENLQRPAAGEPFRPSSPSPLDQIPNIQHVMLIQLRRLWGPGG